ncbi:MAR-binding filament-like protein 1-1 [Chenopodium quinoa]|uniref:MAR-binding filament-like protein 1-1 n=1 Tax=Chenopodium quinoa TaxID=63459 RepID=UPI000B76BE07|nr:MAR-binding filament-like protein 1-1 [Chenopodium quinoa]XP_021739519.1 MAR-binding filament-like protein 1-1 [Chenopodium quinoa]XP_021739520.1 MAR-binding filament-like protein 1-1 [Chenopodium quinoa]XP_021739521.1 MAR-binding filament-like protein 1-1 [Chenopodium quinoa]XP_021739522.1 MAR-binding filament-like protein 1-1 [Chenopodium quinoa]XP_021739523.1 MAR-binding filament-like protein 1-1 [Chenopodium quinoa]XP_021739524.1 MAR-binding filament-like protein 1-1 [Chenopodium quino
MESPINDDMDSLFEGMVLFTPQVVDKHNDNSSMKNGDTSALSSAPSPSSQPLDENLFSDLTVITPSHVEAIVTETLTPSINPSVMTTSTMKSEPQAAPAATMFRQISRKKKRAGLRIGYGRDLQHTDDLEPLQNSSELSPDNENSLATATMSVNTNLNTKADDNLEVPSVSSHPSKMLEVDSCPVEHETECIPLGSDDKVEYQINTDMPCDLTGEGNIAFSSLDAKELPTIQKQEEEEEEANFDSVEVKYEHVKAQVSEKLRQARDQALSISAARKDSRRRRRKAAENVELASLRFKEIEKDLEEACEAEDFEKAERLSENLVAAEKEKEYMLNALKDAEAECDTIDSKMEEALKDQIAAEEECVSLLHRFSVDAVSNADVILENVEVDSSKEMDEWFMSVEAAETKKLELEIESQLVNEARAALADSIEHLVENDIKEKKFLCEKKKVLTQELEELLRLVQEKEAEIAKNDSEIEAADKKIAEVAAGFKDLQTGIDSKFENLQNVLYQMESERQTLSERKEKIDFLITQGKNREKELRKLAMDCEDEANMYQENLRLRKALVISVLKVREEKLRLAQTEEKILADTQMLKQDISAARVDLQELSSNKSSIQQECASIKQRMFFIDKRIPELESEKKVAASARNFKEAARIASEAKSLMAEKEILQSKMEQSVSELGKIEEGIHETTRKLYEIEELVSSKEKEAAVARFQRLHLISAAISCERSAALELGDLEEANVLLAEAEAADSEAKQLQLLHDINTTELGSLTEQIISMEFVSSLDGKQLEELATGGNQIPS